MTEQKKRGRPPKSDKKVSEQPAEMPKASEPAKEKSSLVEMKHIHTGRIASVHPSMVSEYRKGDYQEVK